MKNPFRQLHDARIRALKEGSPLPIDFRAEFDDSNEVEIYLYDVIDDWVGVAATDIIYALAQADERDVLMHLNSPGGIVTEGLAIYNTLKNYQGNVTVRVEGMAASAASFVMLAANTVEIEPNAMVMIHDAWGLTVGPAEDHRQSADVLDKMSDNIATIYAKKSGDSAEHWRDLMKAETWYVGQEAVDAGLVDKTTEEDSEHEAENNKWRTGIFARAPKRVAASAVSPKKPEPAYDFAALREGLKGVLA